MTCASYKQRLLLMNTGNDLGRFRVKQPVSPNIRVIYVPGPVAAGMNANLDIEVTATILGAFEDEMQVVTEKEIYRIPIHGGVCPFSLPLSLSLSLSLALSLSLPLSLFPR